MPFPAHAFHLQQPKKSWLEECGHCRKEGFCLTEQSQMQCARGLHSHEIQRASSEFCYEFSWTKLLILTSRISPPLPICRWQHPSSSFFQSWKIKNPTRRKGMWVCTWKAPGWSARPWFMAYLLKPLVLVITKQIGAKFGGRSPSSWHFIMASYSFLGSGGLQLYKT